MSSSNSVVQSFQPQAPAATVRSVPETELKKITSTFAADMQVTGDYKAKSAAAGLRVEGEYAGKIVFEAGGILHIAAGASVTSSQVEADYVVIEGRFNGTLKARKLLEILPSAVVDGEIKYADMDGHRGARVRGQLDTIQDSAEEQTAKSSSATLQSGQETSAPSSAPSLSATSSTSTMASIASLHADRSSSLSKGVEAVG
jgi:cytoskeletal protein CcmA (bactofilin family)